MGPVTAILLLFVLPIAVLDHFFTSGGEVLRMAGSALVVGGALALLLPRRMVIAAIGGAGGSLAAAVAAVLTTQSGLILPFLALTAAFILIAAVAVYRLRRKAAPAAPRTTPHDL